MNSETLLQEIFDEDNRANPYPLFAELRKTPVAPQAGGTYLVGTYDEITQLLHDPRLSSDVRRTPNAPQPEHGALPAFISTDPPDHDRLRRLAMHQFGPPWRPDRISELEPDLSRWVSELVSALEGKNEFDLVDEVAYPFPVKAICGLLGVPEEDEIKFHDWSQAIVASL